VVDVVGSLQSPYTQLDAAGNKINDPWPTPFPSSGFDLDALGIIHQNTTITYSSTAENLSFNLYPNPAKKNDAIFIEGTACLTAGSIKVTDISGKVHIQELFHSSTQLSGLNTGLYFVHITTDAGTTVKRLVVSE
jgi:hypothetical protein